MKQNIFKSLFFLVAFTAVSDSFIQASDCSSCDTSCSSSSSCNTSCCSGCAQSQNLWQPHSFGVSAGREILLTKPAYAAKENDGWFGTTGAAFEYNRNFGENDGCCVKNKDCCKSIGSLPFWASDKSNQMTVGDNGQGDTKYDLDAYQIGLGPVTTNGTITLNPRIYQTGTHFLLHFGTHQQARSFFATIGGPVGVIAVDPRLCDSGDITPVNYQRGALATGSTTAAPYSTVAEAFAGGKDAGWYKSLKYGKISSCKRSSGAKFGDLALALGCNVISDEKKHLGIAARFSAPTGNTANPEYILDPVFGRNGHWAAGGQLMGHFKVWECDKSGRTLNIWLNATVEHLFRSHHKRTFDLKGNGLGSKYLLLAKYNGTDFANEIVNAANVTTVDVVSSFGVEGNFALTFDFDLGPWSVALGYEGWGRSCEKLKFEKCGCGDPIDLTPYAVLGRQTPDDTNGIMINNAEPAATIGKSQNHYNDDVSRPEGIVDARDKANRLNADACEALDIAGQRAHRAYTCKITGQAVRTWKESRGMPYLGVMGGAEFTHKDNSAVRFWSVGVHGGFSF